MYAQISEMEPHYPARTGELEDLARELTAASARLEGRLAPVVLTEIEALLRVVNSYYSNLIVTISARQLPLVGQITHAFN